ncbi:MAG TPA: PPOX class F420-dependent oxidoreductase [Capillimicrobium sp.]|nr:PPOX class F420-dependent oxidoreductase [Capillimicrobium sp.]
MGLKRRLTDLSYRLYDRSRHRSAFDAAGHPGTAPDFSGLQQGKYALLVTFRRDGTPVPTPVWYALLDDRRLVLSTEERTAKVRRVRRDPRARAIPSDARGKPLGPGVEATVRVLADPAEIDAAEAALDAKYGRSRRVYEKVMTDHSATAYLELSPRGDAGA